jgi:hypothetical protein
MQKKEKIIQRQTLEKKGKKFKNLKLQIKREIIVQKNSKNKIKAYLVIYECWTMCYERSLNLHTYKKNARGNTNLESQIAPIKHKKGASRNNKHNTTKECQ